MERKTMHKDLVEHKGTRLYREGLTRLTHVREGDFEGFLAVWRKRAARLLRFESGLTENQRGRLVRRLGRGEQRDTEAALIALKKRKGR